MCPRSIMLNILGEADGEEGMARAHEVMARAYAVRQAYVFCPAVCAQIQWSWGSACDRHPARS